VLDDPLIAPRHAEVRRSPDGFTLVDIGPNSSTSVRQQPMTELPLESGTIFHLGNTPLLFIRGLETQKTGKQKGMG
jgi:pSer/pThr/pTyr-binding forkhead associated (FHA) protein